VQLVKLMEGCGVPLGDALEQAGIAGDRGFDVSRPITGVVVFMNEKEVLSDNAQSGSKP